MKPTIKRFLPVVAVLGLPFLASAQQSRMVSIGDRSLAVYCAGESSGSSTVILIPAGGSTAKDWAKVQPAVSSFARVCSYDHANFGASDKAAVKLQSADEVVDD